MFKMLLVDSTNFNPVRDIEREYVVTAFSVFNLNIQ